MRKAAYFYIHPLLILNKFEREKRKNERRVNKIIFRYNSLLITTWDRHEIYHKLWLKAHLKQSNLRFLVIVRPCDQVEAKLNPAIASNTYWSLSPTRKKIRFSLLICWTAEKCLFEAKICHTMRLIPNTANKGSSYSVQFFHIILN